MPRHHRGGNGDFWSQKREFHKYEQAVSNARARKLMSTPRNMLDILSDFFKELKEGDNVLQMFKGISGRDLTLLKTLAVSALTLSSRCAAAAVELPKADNPLFFQDSNSTNPDSGSDRALQGVVLFLAMGLIIFAAAKIAGGCSSENSSYSAV